MNGIVVDASVTLSWCFPDEQTPMSLLVLDRLMAGEAAFVHAGIYIASVTDRYQGFGVDASPIRKTR